MPSSHPTRLFSGLDVHDHVCMICDSQAEDDAATAAFVRRGLGEGDKVICIAEDGESERLVKTLWERRVDVSPAIACGQLEIRSSGEFYLVDGEFIIERALDMVVKESQAAKVGGYRALRITGEAARSTAPSHRRAVLDYERGVDRLLREQDAVALCRYRRPQLDVDFCHAVADQHSTAISTMPGALAVHTPLLSVEQRGAGRLAVSGELDFSNVTAFTDIVERAACDHAQLVLDLEGLRFADVAGLRAIYVAASRLGARGGRVSLVRSRAPVRRAFQALSWNPVEALVIT
jgi:anti-anti-sigma factor